MNFDETRIDEAILALLYVFMHDDHRAWKTYDFDAMDRLREHGLISHPATKAKSVVLTEEGEAKAKVLAKRLFGRE